MILSDKKDRIAIISLFVLSVVCYWKTFDNYYFLDDTNAVFAGYLLSHDITKIFTYPFGYIYMSPLWRVVAALSYVPNYLISGYDPWSYYLVNLLLHFGNSVLVYLIVTKLAGNKALSLLIAVLFSVSLNKADAVMMIAHRTTLMGAFFVLLSLLFYIGIVLDGYTRKRFLYVLLFFVAALGSYETALVLPAVFVGFGLIYKGKDFFKKELLLVNLAMIALVAALVWYLNLGPSTTGGSVITEQDIWGKGYHIFRNVLSVFPSFIIPPFLLQSSEEVYHNATIYFGWIEYLSLSLIIGIMIVNIRAGNKLIYFALIFFFFTAIPSAAPRWGYYPDNRYIGDMRFSIGKYSYLSSLGFYIAFGSLAYRLYEYLSIKLDKKALIKISGYLLISSYLIFNIYWLYDREQTWDTVTNSAREQIESIRSLNLKVGNDTHVYVGNVIIYHNHARSLLRVIYDNPDLDVKDVRDYRPGLNNKGRSVFIVADYDRVKATWVD